MGSCILKYVDEAFTLFVVGWRGTSSLRAYVDRDETVHILRLLGADLSKFEVNKYEKAKEAAAALAAEEAAKAEAANAEEEEEQQGDAETEAMES